MKSPEYDCRSTVTKSRRGGVSETRVASSEKPKVRAGLLMSGVTCLQGSGFSAFLKHSKRDATHRAVLFSKPFF